MNADELSPDAVWRALLRYRGWHLIRDSYLRFRYGDGFSHARAFGLQLCLAVVPFLIALTGLAVRLGAETGGSIIGDTVLALTPDNSVSLVSDVLPAGEKATHAGALALVLGLLTGMVALTLAMAQIERGANRIYGVERDRPAMAKYARATVLALCAGLPALVGFVILVAGGPIGASLHHRLHWPQWAGDVWSVARWPLSLVLTVLAVTVIFRRAPRRQQPSLTWLVVGAGLACALWWLASLLLAWYVHASGAFGATYGPLTAVMALLLWANLTGVALFLGLAFAAQLEARRVGAGEPVVADKWEPREEAATR
jgi:YihY family inner membrane protein